MTLSAASRILAYRSSRVAAAVLMAIVAAALLAPVCAIALGVHADVPDLALRRCHSEWPHVLGCDDVGQDLMLRMLYGARVSLFVGFASAALSSLLGLMIGVLAGAAGGRIDALLMRIVDAMLAIPVLPLLLLASAMAIGKSPAGASTSAIELALLLALFGWMGVARIARAETMRTRQLDFVVAARALGARAHHVLALHVLPSVLPSVLVAMTLEVGRGILAEAALSFLGLGVQPPTPSWGNMLRHAEDALHSDPRLAFWPGSAILLTVTCVYVVGGALRRALDPREGSPPKRALR